MSDDDWMNPSTSSNRLAYEPPTGIEWEIQRKRRLITFGSPAYQWVCWRSFKTEDEMWKALDELRAEHPSWHLRGRSRNHDLERVGIYPQDDEMDAAFELVRRRTKRSKP